MRVILTHNRLPENALRPDAATGIVTLDSVRHVRQRRARSLTQSRRSSRLPQVAGPQHDQARWVRQAPGLDSESGRCLLHGHRSRQPPDACRSDSSPHAHPGSTRGCRSSSCSRPHARAVPVRSGCHSRLPADASRTNAGRCAGRDGVAESAARLKTGPTWRAASGLLGPRAWRRTEPEAG